MDSVIWHQNPQDPNGPITITPKPGQTIKVVIPDTHRAGPDKNLDNCVVVRPKE